MSEKTVKQQATEECHIHGMEEKRQTDFITSHKTQSRISKCAVYKRGILAFLRD